MHEPEGDPPANDLIQNAIMIPSLPFTNEQSTIGAGQTSTSQPFNFTRHTVYYGVDFPVDTPIVIEARADFRVCIGVYETADFSSHGSTFVTRFYSTATPHFAMFAQVRFTALAGQKYAILFGGVHGQFESGQWGDLEVSAYAAPPLPLNDDRSDAFTISPLTTTLNADNTGATRAQGEPGASSLRATLWWKFSLNEITELTFTYTHDLGQKFFAVRPAGSSTVIRSMNVTSGDEENNVIVHTFFPGDYEIQIGSFETGTNGFITSPLQIEIAALGNITPPTNIDPASALLITSTNYSNAQSTRGSPDSYVWYRIELGTDALVEIHTHGSNFNTQIRLYDENLNQLRLNSNSPIIEERPQSWMDEQLNGGVTYYLSVNGVSSETGDLILTTRSVVAYVIDTNEWPVVSMANWDYERCDGVPWDWTWAWFISSGQTFYENDDPWHVSYWEAYEFREPGEPIVRLIAMFHFPDDSWDVPVCPTVPAVPFVGADPYFPQGPTGGWSASQPGYERSALSGSASWRTTEHIRARDTMGEDYNPAIEQSVWNQVVDYIEPLERDWDTSAGGGPLWLSGASRVPQLEPIYTFYADYNMRYWRPVVNVAGTREWFPNVIDPELDLELQSAVPGSFWIGTRYIRHVTRPTIKTVELRLEHFSVGYNKFGGPDETSYPVHLDVEFFIDSSLPVNHPTPPRLRTFDQPDHTVVAQKNEGQVNSNEYSIVSGGHLVPSETSTSSHHLFTEAPAAFAIIEDVVDQGQLDGELSPGSIPVPILIQVDGKYVRNYTPPPFGGAGASLFGDGTLSGSANTTGIRVYVEVEWGEWQYWDPDKLEAPRIPPLRLVQRDDVMPA